MGVSWEIAQQWLPGVDGDSLPVDGRVQQESWVTRRIRRPSRVGLAG
jgi:hypothetical protein